MIKKTPVFIGIVKLRNITGFDDLVTFSGSAIKLINPKYITLEAGGKAIVFVYDGVTREYLITGTFDVASGNTEAPAYFTATYPFPTYLSTNDHLFILTQQFSSKQKAPTVRGPGISTGIRLFGNPPFRPKCTAIVRIYIELLELAE